ncbi:type I methionyl aminopeptidase [Mesomycoplasma neurolyticum]|uniref:Methionine aminopeptidase n=1 Tax=Mesomycoplasma neurolyticum TaxID=2120 RepID=A0A449A6A3_9BACT|nr:type I methionyl aminopeptidase [Mesomycoplasma neurolyticum]VEU59747.1 Methionine aminopeptidase [Mesomycoplasma neurolyticum]
MANLIKTEQEIQLIKQSCQILKEVKKILFDFIKPGISILEIDKLAYEEIIKRGGKPAFLNYQGFPNTICASLNDELIHGIPNDRILKDYDLISIDIGVIYKGYYSDSAFTKSVGKTNEENESLIKAAKDAFYAGINAIEKNVKISTISNAIYQEIKKHNFYTPLEFTGHGIGKNLHEKPDIPNHTFFNKTGPMLKDNMVICIEPMILQDSPKVKILGDKWTVVARSGKKAAHYEQTVLIKNNKAEILT